MRLVIDKSTLEIESKNIFTAINGWKSKLSGGYDGLFSFEYNKKFIDSIKNKELILVENFIIKEIKNEFELKSEALGKKAKELKNSWKDVKNIFLSELESVFGKPNMNIKCYVIFSCGWGSYDVNENEVYVSYEMEDLLYTLCHEICHLYYYYFINKNFKNYDKVKAWRLSEILVNFILIKDKLSTLWSNEKENYYDEIIDIDKIWKDWNSIDIKDFFNKYLY